MPRVQQRSRIGPLILALAGFAVLGVVVTNWPSRDKKPSGPEFPNPGSPIVTVDAAPVPVTVVPAPGKASPKPAGTRHVLIFVAGWGTKPPTIMYTYAGTTHYAYPQEQGPWQWQNVVTPVPGEQYFMSVGSSVDDNGVIFCRMERDGIIVNESERRDTHQDPGAVRCKYTEPKG